MARQYDLNIDSELMVRPLLKEKPRKVMIMSVGYLGVLVLMCNTARNKNNNR